jgi:ferritin-like metal-binding protein YciE
LAAGRVDGTSGEISGLPINPPTGALAPSTTNKDRHGTVQERHQDNGRPVPADDLFLHTLQDIHYAENKIVKSLPDMIENARDAELKQGLQAHLGETKGHVKRLEQVFQMLGQKPKAVTCPAIDGIIDEADDITGEVDDKDVLDAAIIAAGQAVEHYEMTRYGSLIAWAKRLGRADVARILDQTLTEEKAADKKLTTIAETKVNLRAAS